MIKSKQDNDMSDCIDATYVEIEIELSRSIEQNLVYHKN